MTPEMTMIMTSEETDELVRVWGMDDIDRALQNLELERQRLERALSGTQDALKLEREALAALSVEVREKQEEIDRLRNLSPTTSNRGAWCC